MLYHLSKGNNQYKANKYRWFWPSTVSKAWLAARKEQTSGLAAEQPYGSTEEQ